MKWPWVRRSRHEVVVDAVVSALKLQAEAQGIASDLTKRLAQAHNSIVPLQQEVAALKLSAPTAALRYAEHVRRWLELEISDQDPTDGHYTIGIRLDCRAPELFGNGDEAAWAYYAETVAREVATKLKNTRFVHKRAMTSPLSRPATGTT